MSGISDLRYALDRAAFARSLGLELDGWQEDLLRSQHPRTILLCSRQAGKSTMAAIIGLHRTLYRPGALVLCLAPSLRQSQELFSKTVGYFRDLGRPVPPLAERQLSLELTNGSRIVTLPSTEKTIRGYSGASILICDEAARIEDSLYHAVRPMLAVSGGDLLLLSTAYTTEGVFYETWVGGGEWRRYKVPATDVPRIPDSFLEEEENELPEPVYLREYMCEFHSPGDRVFSEEQIERMFDPSVPALTFGVKIGDI